ncbi:MAG: L-threonylcarbamoyladenylate synthase [Alphaproteobacteria bacterium]|nr:L-threonylcarbamoyladenylate synthase [Alphaproteobacteria bacterium]
MTKMGRADVGLDQAKAAELLRAGKLVAFPTETVYGLGADATNGAAVAGIFAAKQRPSFNPLISHLAGIEAVEQFAQWNEPARALADAFWPGALTMVLPRTENCAIADITSAGLNSVALRVPSHPDAHAMLAAVDRPIAAPSANRSGRISPTTAAHVADELGHAVALILDGGPCAIGLESTVVGFDNDKVVLLRPGGISLEQLEAVAGTLLQPSTDPDAPSSPGQLASHYAPSKPLRLDALRVEAGEVLLGFGPDHDGSRNLSVSGDLNEAAANLFAMLRLLDQEGEAVIAVVPIPERGLGLAINDRLRRAAAPRT